MFKVWLCSDTGPCKILILSLKKNGTLGASGAPTETDSLPTQQAVTPNLSSDPPHGTQSLRGTPPINHGFYAAQPLMLRMEGGETSCFYNTIFMKFSPSLPSLCVHLFINIYISLAIYLSFLLKIIFPSPLLCLPSCYSRSNLFPSLSSCLSLSTLLSSFLLGEFSWFFSWKP